MINFKKVEKIELKKPLWLTKKHIVLFVIVVAVTILSIFIFTDRIYDNSKSFSKFAKNQFEEDFYIVPSAESSSISSEFGDCLSWAVESDKIANEHIASVAEKKVSSLKKEIAKEVAGDKKSALLIKCHTYESDKGVTSLLIYAIRYEEDTEEKEMYPVEDYVFTGLYKTKNGNSIKNIQIVKKNYKEILFKQVQKYVRKGYTKRDLAATWEEFFQNNKEHLNTFIITDSSIIFFERAGADGAYISSEIPLKKTKDAVRAHVIKRVVTSSDKMVAITFDDGPGGEAEERILKALDQQDAVATFFYLGCNIKGREDNIKKAYDLGCEIGNHSWKHPDLATSKKSVIKKQITSTNEAIKNITGENPTVFRPPYGSYDKLVKKTCNMPIVLWSVDSLDWSYKNADKTLKQIKKTDNLDGRIILMHSIYDSSAEAVEKLLPWLNENGYQTVTVSELIKYKYGTTLKKGKSYY